MSRAFNQIASHYGLRCSKRGSIPLILHIMQGLHILRIIGAEPAAREAYCLHPLIQADEDLKANWTAILEQSHSPRTIMYLMEYRRTANAWLRGMDKPETPLSPIRAVNDMLIADKVQNRYSFEKHHKGTHPDSVQLDEYFQLWLGELGVTEDEYLRWVSEFEEVAGE